MKQSLPWESVPPPIYTARALKPRKKWVKIGGWILVVFLLLFGIASRADNLPLALISCTFSVLYAITMVTKKDAAITSRGLEIFYNMMVTTQYDFFSWEEINSIVREDRGDKDYVRLHIGYSSVEKALFFKRTDVDGIYALAKAKNPAIRIMDYAAAPPKTSQKRKKNK